MKEDGINENNENSENHEESSVVETPAEAKKSRKEKIKNWKPVRWCRKKISAVRDFCRASFENTDKGAMLLEILLTGVVLGFFAAESFFVALPVWVCVILVIFLLLLAGELLRFVLKILFGAAKRSRIYGLLQFLMLMLCSFADISSVLFAVIFSLVLSLTLNLFGRCLWALLKQKRFKPLVFVCLTVSVAVLAATGVLLASEGSKKSYIEDYLALKNRGAAKQLSLKESGENYPVSVLTYGMAAERDMHTMTYDLTPFAEQNFLDKPNRKKVLGLDLSCVPLEGIIWYPQGQKNCPTLFIIHGNHAYTEDSYFGYDYLGKYLASCGYVVVSVNENACNGLSEENDARAVLLLENMKYILEQNADASSVLYQRIDSERIAIAGHSRGGEAVSEAYLFNRYDSYPEDGNVKFSYGFSIQAIMAIAPTVDQYTPAGREVALRDVNYFIIHGANDQDVNITMGQKQYENVSFSGGGDYLKSLLYVSGANHGQFNTRWGRYDLEGMMNRFLNVASFIEESKQQEILKIFAKVFLDVTLKGDRTNERLLKECQRYAAVLPRTVYQQMYQTSGFVCLADFEQDSDLNTAAVAGGRIETANLSEWTEERAVFGIDATKENYVMKISWEDTREAEVCLNVPEQDLRGKSVVFDVADLSEEKTCAKEPYLVDGTVTLKDAKGNRASVRISDATAVYPSLPVRLNKLDYLFGGYQYKHPFQTVTIPEETFLQGNSSLDMEQITEISIRFDYCEKGSLWLDNIGVE